MRSGEALMGGTARAGEVQRTFEALLDAHRGIVFKLAHAYCPAGEERQDLAQEIRLQLWHAFPSYDSARPFSTWMYRVALNTAISFARDARVRHRRAVPLDATTLVEPAKPATDDRATTLYGVLHGLEELDRAL